MNTASNGVLAVMDADASDSAKWRTLVDMESGLQRAQTSKQAHAAAKQKEGEE